MTLQEYIYQNWDKTVKYAPKDEGTRIGLPYPYTAPCMTESFTALFYWDTYFTNKGLLASGEYELAENNVKDFIFLLSTYGRIPNCADTRILTRSQPPFFGLMLRDILECKDNPKLKKEGYHALVKEMEFWETKRKSPNGLNHYSSDIPSNDIELQKETVEFYRERTGIEKPLSFPSTLNVLSECESGWDYNPRFNGKCNEYNPVDLNSLLWFNEGYLGELERELGISDGSAWENKARLRKRRMEQTLLRCDGIFVDYSYTENKRSRILSVASFMPSFVGMQQFTQVQVQKLITQLELPYGLQATTDNYGKSNYQWGKAIIWAPLQFIAVQALQNSGFDEDASRIAQKYITLVTENFESTGRLWEKYDGRTGAPSLMEYTPPEMLGWTAGVYLTLLSLRASDSDALAKSEYVAKQSCSPVIASVAKQSQ